MAEQDLNGAQVRSGFKKVGRETVAQRVGMNAPVIETSAFGGEEVSAILCKRRSLVMARWSGRVRFCLLPDARIVGIIRLSRTAVKAELSEFILSLDGGRSQPYGFHPGIG